MELANDIARHLQKQKHQENEKAELAATKRSHKITSFVKKSDDYSVINAEVHFTDFLVEHNIALNVSDHAGPQCFVKCFQIQQ